MKPIGIKRVTGNARKADQVVPDFLDSEVPIEQPFHDLLCASRHRPRRAEQQALKEPIDKVVGHTPL